MALFLSTFVNRIDRKGRVSVPASFRAALAQEAFPGVVCFPSFTAPCLEGMGVARLEALAAGADSQAAAFSAEMDELATLVFAQSRQLAWDGEGRIVLPEELIAHAGIKEQVAFVGMGRTFQVWEPEAHRQILSGIRVQARANRPTVRLAGEPGSVPGGGK